MNDDGDLLRRFAETRDEVSFSTLVQRRIGFVYAISVRRLRDPHAAQDATQAVFVALARKAAAVARGPSVMGWLHRAACYETRNIMRSQTNRLAREAEAHHLGIVEPEPPQDFGKIEAVLDDVLRELGDADREAILARYFSGFSYSEMGATLQVSENTARMRVERALAKLRSLLARRGVTSTALVLSEALPNYASASVPSGMVASVVKASLLPALGALGITATFTSMSTAKIVFGVALAAAIGGSLYELRENAQIEASLSRTRTESAVSQKQLQQLENEIAALKRQVGATRQPTSTVANSKTTFGSGAALLENSTPGVTPKPPKGWFKNGSANELYEVGVDENNAWGGMPSAYAKSTGDAEGRFGGMMQTIAADAFQNQRVRLTGWVKTQDANDGGGHLWLRIDGQQPNQILGFDNMDGRAPKGTTDWQEYSLVLDVPKDATTLNYGFFVQGRGQIWVNGVTVTPVGTEVPTTNMAEKRPALPTTPVNLGFTPPTKK